MSMKIAHAGANMQLKGYPDHIYEVFSIAMYYSCIDTRINEMNLRIKGPKVTMTIIIEH